MEMIRAGENTCKKNYNKAMMWLLYMEQTEGVTYFTAWARMHLYSCIDRLREIAIYYDTDSFILIQPMTEPWPIAIGDKLGQAVGPEYLLQIAEFVFGSPKITHTVCSPMKAGKVYVRSGVSL